MKASNFRNIHFETELLESLDWDGEKLMSLYNYIDEAIKVDKPNSMHMLKIIEHVSKNYSKQTADLIKKLFVESEKEINKDGNSKD
jgi:hypothetical protein